jgi:hypothetical protein
LDKIKKKPLSESWVYGRDSSIRCLLRSKEAVVNQLKNEKFEDKEALGVGFSY